MRKKLLTVFASFAICLLLLPISVKAAPIKVLGIQSTGFGNRVVGALTGINFTEVSPTSFATVDLNQYDVLYIGETFMSSNLYPSNDAALNALYGRKDDLASWIYSGHGVVALSEPIGPNPWEWVPDAVRPTIGKFNFSSWVYIVNRSHPVMSGITPKMLSWGTCSHANFADTGGLTLMAESKAGKPITLAGEYGLGKLVLTSQDPNAHYEYFLHQGQPFGGIEFVQNAINWTGGVSTVPVVPTVPEPGTMLLLATGFIGIFPLIRK